MTLEPCCDRERPPILRRDSPVEPTLIAARPLDSVSGGMLAGFGQVVRLSALVLALFPRALYNIRCRYGATAVIQG